jgi:hypothetical protein
MVAFLFLFAPTVVLIAVLIMQRFQPWHDRDPLTLMDQDPLTSMQRDVDDDRIEPRFGAVNDNTEYESHPEIWMDQHSISTG